MRRITSLLLTGALFIGLLAVPTAAGAADPVSIGATVIAVSSDEGPDDNPQDFDILLAAILADDLLTAAVLGTGDFEGVDLSVFAPTDQAFMDFTGTMTEAAAAAALGDLIGTPALQDIVLYHVVAGTVASSADVFGGEGTVKLTMANGDVLKARNNRLIDGLGVRTFPKFKAVDIAASNGVIHTVKGVLSPPVDPEPVSIGATVIAASSDEGPDSNPKDYDILLAAILADDVLTAAVLGTGDFAGVDLTVFAPTDQAFMDFTGTTTEAEAAAALGGLLGTAALQNIVLYHVVAGEAASSADVFTDGVVKLTMANGDVLKARNNRLIDGIGNRVFPKFKAVDIEASNGLIHTIKEVLSPPAS